MGYYTIREETEKTYQLTLCNMFNTLSKFDWSYIDFWGVQFDEQASDLFEKFNKLDGNGRRRQK